MSEALGIRSACGQVQGRLEDIARQSGNHCVCYCKDCQSFAHFLGNADEILDEHGGTEVFQYAPRYLQFTSGFEHVACVRLTENGTLRWYADCCRTPICNTSSRPGLPFVGLIHSCIGDGSEGTPRARLIGPVAAGVNTGSAKCEPDALPDFPRSTAAMTFSVIFWLLKAWVRGDNRPSPFFDGKTGEPTVAPRVLSAEELAAVEKARDAW